jgi:NAD(P)-dependent dehydrogenase (short-subunit alcohol dehydrogenase family)
MGRSAEPEEIAAVIVPLLSPTSAQTAAVVAVDGGHVRPDLP